MRITLTFTYALTEPSTKTEKHELRSTDCTDAYPSAARPYAVVSASARPARIRTYRRAGATDPALI